MVTGRPYSLLTGDFQRPFGNGVRQWQAQATWQGLHRRCAVEIRLLGPVEVIAADRDVPVGGPRVKTVLAMLALRANHVVASESISAQLWPDLEPDRAAANLQVRVSELRRALRLVGESDRIIRRAPGYLLRVSDGELDVAKFADLVAQARVLLATGDPGGAGEAVQGALRLWRGAPLADLADAHWAQGDVARLEEARAVATELRAESRLAAGGGEDELAGELAQLTRVYPLRERLWAMRMQALYRAGRQAESLAAFQQARSTLAEELGIDPGPELRELHARILAQDPGLAAPPRATAASGSRSRPVPRELPADVAEFTGRIAELAELDWMLPAPEREPGEPPGPVVIAAICGTAGVGKTALATHWAHQVAGHFPVGQLYVNLRGYDPAQPLTADEALAKLLRSLGVADADIPLEQADRSARYRSLVSGERLLVVLDNATNAEHVRPLLPGTESAMVVVTSRDSLAGLVARDGARRLDLDPLPDGDAAELLEALIGLRATAEPEATGKLAGLCSRLPLALRVAAELAVASPDAPLAELAAELEGLEDRLAALEAGEDPRLRQPGLAGIRCTTSCAHTRPRWPRPMTQRIGATR